MLQPSKKAITQVKNNELVRIANMHKLTINVVDLISNYTSELLPKIAKSRKPSIYYKQIEAYMIKNYGALYLQYKNEIVNALNESGIEQLHLVELALKEPVELVTPLVLYKTIPKTPAFEITNRVLSQKSSLAYSKKLAKNVTKAITNSFDKGESVQQASKKVDMLLGLRDKQGKITPENLRKIKNGELVLSNSALAKSQVIARTEITRAARIQAYQVYENIDREDKRLRYIGTSDKRSRPNSISMNGQISDKNATFKYPDQRRYKMFEAPAMYSINDRCSQVVVFID